MRYNRHDALFLLITRRDRVNEQIDFPIRDQAPIFHGTGRKGGDCNHIQFGQGIGSGKKVIVQFQ